MGVGDFCFARDGLAVGNLRRTDVRFNFEFTTQTVHQNVEVKFAHALHDGLAGFQIRFNAEGGVFCSQTRQTGGHLLLVSLGFRLNRDFDNRIGEGHCFKNNRVVDGAKRVTGCCVFQTCQRDDVSRERFLNFFTIVGVHHHHTTDALFLTFGGVQERVALVQHTGVDAGKGQRANKGVVHDFERQTGEGHVVIRTACDVTGLCLVAWFEAHVVNNVHRGWQIVDNSVQQRLNTFVFERGAAEYGDELDRQCPFADQTAQGVDVRLCAVHQVVFHGFVIHLDRSLDQMRAPFVGQVFQLGTDFALFPARAKIFTGPDPFFHGDQIDHAFQLGFGTDRNLDRRRCRTGTVFDHLHAVEEVSADFVHFVDENDAWNLVAVRLAPNGFGLGLNTGVGVKNSNRAVKNGQRTFNFDGEVNVAGGVDDVHPVLGVGCRVGCWLFLALPESGRRSGSNCNTAFLLLLHPVHRGGTVVHFADVVGLTSVKQDPFGAGCFACVDVGHDAEIAVA